MKELIRDIVVALVIVLVLTSIIKPTIVKESSMEPTLYENHYLIVNKLAYKTGEPERGDIIVFESDLETDDGDKKLLIKRIKDGISPGEIEDCYIEDGELFVMGDNRIVSIDSRELGCINEETVMGKAVLRLFPFNQIGGLYK